MVATSLAHLNKLDPATFQQVKIIISLLIRFFSEESYQYIVKKSEVISSTGKDLGHCVRGPGLSERWDGTNITK